MMSNPGQRNVIIGIVVAVVLGLAVAAVVAGLVIGFVVRSVGEGEGDVSFRTERPTSIEELQNSYEFESGSLEINLNDVELSDGTTEVQARGDTGALTVVVPRGVGVRADAKVENGAVSFFDQNMTGENIEQDFEEAGYTQANRRLSLDLSMGTGVISVVREG
ncbi:MAG: LiaF domain-containing protein [Rubrobacteraceae bacterium]